MADIELVKCDNVHMHVVADSGIKMEIMEEFSFYAKNYKFHPKVKNKMWDGKIRLLNSRTSNIYIGLIYKLYKFAKARGYTIKIDKDLINFNKLTDEDIEKAYYKYVDSEEFDLRDYQLSSVLDCMYHKRKLLLSPTSSGKSLIIYLICRMLNEMGFRVLITTTSISLVGQLADDFRSYRKDKSEVLKINEITSGVEKYTDDDIVVSTWQSAWEMPEDWFDQFDAIIGDEAHTYQAKSLVAMMEKAKNAEYRIGMTGTLDESEANKMTLEGLFGPVVQYITTQEMIERGYAATITIHAIVLSHTQKDRKELSDAIKKVPKNKPGMKFSTEADFIAAHERRNKYVCDLMANVNGNTLSLYQFVDKHGTKLYELLKERKDPEKVFFIHGGAKKEYRENAKRVAENSDDVTLLASFGTFQQGESVKRINNLVIAFTSKSRIRILQSLGRGLRKGNGKFHVNVFDIVDDLKHGGKDNYALSHFRERYRYYLEEGHTVKIHNISLGD